MRYATFTKLYLQPNATYIHVWSKQNTVYSSHYSKKILPQLKGHRNQLQRQVPYHLVTAIPLATGSDKA